MKFKQITAKQFAKQTDKFLDQAQRSPLVIRSEQGPALLIRPVSDDDVAVELIVGSPRFRASIRRARANRAQGKGVPLQKVRRTV
jgi:hypothetical protein